MVYIEPAAVGAVVTDEKRARAVAIARDETGATLDITVPLRRENNLLVDNLERLFGPRQRVTRRSYLVAGFSLAILKFAIDSAIVSSLMHCAS